DPMPPAEEKLRPNKDEVAALERWIQAGAPAPETAARAPVTAAEVHELIRKDLDAAPPRDRPFLRYFTLNHLHNAGLSADEIHSHRHALSKLVNSLSWGKRVIVPKGVDPAGAVLRIDLRDYQWNEKVWDTILERNPYGVRFGSEAFKACAEE